MPNPLYITGLMETGKTTLSTFFDGHEKLLVFPEEAKFGYIFRNYEYIDDRVIDHYLKCSPFLKSGELQGIKHVDEDIYQHKMFIKHIRRNEKLIINYSSFMNIVMEAFSVSFGKNISDFDYWVFNEANCSRLTPWLVANNTNTKIIHLVRDPREHYISIKAHYARKGIDLNRNNLLYSCLKWSYAINLGIKYKKIYGSERYFILRYEDLINDTENTMRRLSTFLKIDYADGMLIPTKLGITSSKAASENIDDVSLDLNKHRIKESSMEKWIEELSYFENLYIEILCYRFMNNKICTYKSNNTEFILKPLSFIVRWCVVFTYSLKKLLKNMFSPMPLYKIYEEGILMEKKQKTDFR